MKKLQVFLPFLLLFSLLTLPLLADAKADADAAKQAAKEDKLMKETEEVAAGKKALNGPSSDTWLIAAWDWTSAKAKAGWKAMSELVTKVLSDDFHIENTDWTATVILLVVLTIMLLSGGWAASIAQMRRHPRLPFFLMGCFTFFIGPVYLLYTLDIKGEKERLERLAQESAARKAAEAEKARLEQEAKVEQGYEAPAVSNQGVVWNQEYFSRIARKPDGTPAGPWSARYNDVDVTVREILEALPDFVQARVINLEGKEIVTRIPYSRIQKWE